MLKRTLSIDIQKQVRQEGRIRIGEKKKTAAGKEYPSARETFRLTGPNRAVLETLQKAYGGELRKWDGHPGQWELLTDRNQISCIIHAERSVSQAFEQWSGGGCTHRCDGVTCIFTRTYKENGKTVADPPEETECICDPEDRDCALTTRLAVLLPDSKDITLWRLDSKGTIFAGEVQAAIDMMRSLGIAAGPIYCLLTINKQEIKKPGQAPSKFVVPSLSLDPNPPNFPAMIQSLSPSAQALSSGGRSPALGAGAPALEASNSTINATEEAMTIMRANGWLAEAHRSDVSEAKRLVKEHGKAFAEVVIQASREGCTTIEELLTYVRTMPSANSQHAEPEWDPIDAELVDETTSAQSEADDEAISPDSGGGESAASNESAQDQYNPFEDELDDDQCRAAYDGLAAKLGWPTRQQAFTEFSIVCNKVTGVRPKDGDLPGELWRKLMEDARMVLAGKKPDSHPHYAAFKKWRQDHPEAGMAI